MIIQNLWKFGGFAAVATLQKKGLHHERYQKPV